MKKAEDFLDKDAAWNILVRVQTHTCFSLLSRKSRIQKEWEMG
jgi:hypothetical protein